MKNILHKIFILVIIVTHFAKHEIALGIEKIDGNKILKKAFCNETFSLSFEYASKNLDNTEKDQSRYFASVIVSGNMYKMLLEDREIKCNGDTVWTYFPEENEIQISSADNELNIWVMLDKYNKFYKVKSARIDNYKNNSKKYVVELEALSRDNDFKFIIVTLNSASELEKIFIRDTSEEIHEFKVTDFTIEKNVKKSEFTININDYPGVLVTKIDSEI